MHPNPRKIAPVIVFLALVAAAVYYLTTVSGTQAIGPLAASGSVEAVELSLAPEISGRVVEVLVSEGDAVTAESRSEQARQFYNAAATTSTEFSFMNYGFAPLGDANSATKQLIFGGNATKFYKIRLKAADNTRMPAFSADRLAALKNEYALAAEGPSNLRYGYVRAA